MRASNIIVPHLGQDGRFIAIAATVGSCSLSMSLSFEGRERERVLDGRDPAGAHAGDVRRGPVKRHRCRIPYQALSAARITGMIPNMELADFASAGQGRAV